MTTSLLSTDDRNSFAKHLFASFSCDYQFYRSIMFCAEILTVCMPSFLAISSLLTTISSASLPTCSVASVSPTSPVLAIFSFNVFAIELAALHNLEIWYQSWNQRKRSNSMSQFPRDQVLRTGELKRVPRTKIYHSELFHHFLTLKLKEQNRIYKQIDMYYSD